MPSECTGSLQVMSNHRCEEFVSFEPLDEMSGPAITGDIGGIARHEVADDLIDRPITATLESMGDLLEYLAGICPS